MFDFFGTFVVVAFHPFPVHMQQLLNFTEGDSVAVVVAVVVGVVVVLSLSLLLLLMFMTENEAQVSHLLFVKGASVEMDVSLNFVPLGVTLCLLWLRLLCLLVFGAVWRVRIF